MEHDFHRAHFSFMFTRESAWSHALTHDSPIEGARCLLPENFPCVMQLPGFIICTHKTLALRSQNNLIYYDGSKKVKL